MRLTDLNPRFLSHGGEGVTQNGQPVPLREAVGLTFTCPCGCGEPLSVLFHNPPDGQGPISMQIPMWTRTGETFETMTLDPSILRRNNCGWHGWIRNGEVLTG